MLLAGHLFYKGKGEGGQHTNMSSGMLFLFFPKKGILGEEGKKKPAGRRVNKVNVERGKESKGAKSTRPRQSSAMGYRRSFF